jgi:DNA-binding NtrC family response regulator
MELKNVLVFSEDSADRDSLRTTMPVIANGADMQFASAADDYRACLSAFSPQVVIIDTALGEEATSQILADTRKWDPDVRVILLADAKTWLNWRFTGGRYSVLLKGFSIRQLANAIQTESENGRIF